MERESFEVDSPTKIWRVRFGYAAGDALSVLRQQLIFL
jgi:hypothetical protein